MKRICEYCGKEFYVRPSEIKKGQGKFCSRKCHGKSRRQRVKRICEFCSEKFYVFPSVIKKGRGRFCSQDCHYKFRTKNKPKYICQQCGKEFYAKPSEIKEGNGKYCSKKCFGRSLLKSNVGYRSLHTWVKKYKPKSSTCEICGKITIRLDAANISGEYKRDINDFVYLCTQCHTGKKGFDVTKRKNPNVNPITILNSLKKEKK